MNSLCRKINQPIDKQGLLTATSFSSSRTWYQAFAKCDLSQLFDVLNMKSDHRAKQMSANSMCQKQSTPITIQFLSWVHVLCRH